MNTKRTIFVTLILLWLSAFVLAFVTRGAVPPLNSTGVAENCDNDTVPCEYLDMAVPPGLHFYFVVAEDADGYSGPSNSVTVTVPNDGESHNVDIAWNPSTTLGVVYFIYRGAPASNLTAGPSQ